MFGEGVSCKHHHAGVALNSFARFLSFLHGKVHQSKSWKGGIPLRVAGGMPLPLFHNITTVYSGTVESGECIMSEFLFVFPFANKVPALAHPADSQYRFQKSQFYLGLPIYRYIEIYRYISNIPVEFKIYQYNYTSTFYQKMLHNGGIIVPV